MLCMLRPQVSVLRGGAQPAAQHWFTATPDPQRSVFKPFAFTATGPVPDPGRDQQQEEEDEDGEQQQQQQPGSPYTVAAPARRNPPHRLWQAWQAAYEGRGSADGSSTRPALSALRDLEARGTDPEGGLTFRAAVEEEMRLYGALE